MLTPDRGTRLSHHTQSYLLLELIAISGELPAEQIRRLSGGSSYKDNIIKALKKEKLIRVYYRDRLRAYRLSAKAKGLLLADNYERFAFFLTGNAETNQMKSEITRRLRLHRIAETYVMMQNAGIAVYRDRKPYVFFPENSGDVELPDIRAPAFYNSREVKEIGMEFVKIRGARMVGILLSEASIFVVYNTGDGLMKWDYKPEMRTKALMKTVLCQQRLSHQYEPEDVCGLMLGKDMEVAYQLLTSTGGAKRNYFVLDGNYDHFYFLPTDHRGDMILKILSSPDMTAQLNHILSENLYLREPGSLIENDAMNENSEPVLFAYSFDMPRIVRFNTALRLYNRRGTVICFDFQFDILRRYCGEYIDFHTISFEKLERRIRHEQG